MSAITPTERPRVSLRNISKLFRRQNGQTFNAVDNVSVDVTAGEFLVLLGPSGCGKTTLLRSIAGLEQPDAGRIELDGKAVFDAAARVDVPPEKRRIGMVFQSYALWPHMTVLQNVAYPLRMRKVPVAEANARAAQILGSVNIPDLVDQYPGRISGGQQQRVALARALVSSDQIILFDEPLSNVDAKVREHLRTELLAMQRELRFTAIYVTHDQEEALALATNIAVMKAGKIMQLAPPQELYRRPRSLYVGTFLGSANVMQGRLVADASGATVDTPLGVLRVRDENIAASGGACMVLSRPERWSITAERPSPEKVAWNGQIKTAAYVGSRNEYVVVLKDLEIKIWSFGDDLFPAGSQVWCAIDDSAWIVVARDEPMP